MPAVLVAALVAAAVAFAGCSADGPPVSGGSSGAPSASRSPSTGPGGATASEPVTVTDSRGREVTLGAPARDVVALEWTEAETLTTLGVPPVGVADVDGYETWVSRAQPLPDDVEDVGSRSEPSIDSVLALEPDVVVTEAEGGARVVEQLEKHVPVVTVRGSSTNDNLGQLKRNVELLATLTGTEDRARRVLSDLTAAIANARRKLARTGMDRSRVVVADSWTQDSTVLVRTYGKGSLVSDLVEAMGLRNAWTGPVDPMWGTGRTDVGGLRRLDDVHFFHLGTEDDVFAQGLDETRAWESLPFVREGRVHEVAQGTWPFGGPASARLFVHRVVAALTA